MDRSNTVQTEIIPIRQINCILKNRSNSFCTVENNLILPYLDKPLQRTLVTESLSLFFLRFEGGA